MKTTVQALKELYAKLGGDLADVALIDRVPDMIEALNSIAVAVPAPTAEDEGKVMTVGEDGELGFANALPPVTSGDAGKVLTVDEQGAWNPAEASGGGGGLPVVTPDDAYKIPIVSEDGEWNLEYIPEQLPPIYADQDVGRVLTARGEDFYAWDPIPTIGATSFQFNHTSLDNLSITVLNGVTTQTLFALIRKYGIAIAVLNPNTAVRSNHLMMEEANGVIHILDVKEVREINGVSCIVEYDIRGKYNGSRDRIDWTITYVAYKIEASGPSQP